MVELFRIPKRGQLAPEYPPWSQTHFNPFDYLKGSACSGANSSGHLGPGGQHPPDPNSSNFIGFILSLLSLGGQYLPDWHFDSFNSSLSNSQLMPEIGGQHGPEYPTITSSPSFSWSEYIRPTLSWTSFLFDLMIS